MKGGAALEYNLAYDPGITEIYTHNNEYERCIEDGHNIIDTLGEEMHVSEKCIDKGYNDCHRSIETLLEIIKKIGIFSITISNPENPVFYKGSDVDLLIDLYLKQHSHYLLSFHSQGHYWHMEIYHDQFRILSTYAGEHTFFQYMTDPKYKYGHFQTMSDNFKENLNILSISTNQPEKNRADQHIFGDGIQYVQKEKEVFPQVKLSRIRHLCTPLNHNINAPNAPLPPILAPNAPLPPILAPNAPLPPILAPNAPLPPILAPSVHGSRSINRAASRKKHKSKKNKNKNAKSSHRNRKGPVTRSVSRGRSRKR